MPLNPEPGTLNPEPLNAFHYVYILVSKDDPTRHYIGLTDDLENRLKAHNWGQVPNTFPNTALGKWKLRLRSVPGKRRLLLKTTSRAIRVEPLHQSISDG